MRRRALLVAAGAVVWLVAAPAEALAATVAVTTPSASPVPSLCPTTPCNDPPAAQLTLTQTADKTTAAVGDTVTYTITVGNTGSLPAAAVTVDEVLGGSAGFLVEDGTASTANTFVGSPMTTITRVVTGHYRWTYPTVNPGDSDVVRFSAIMVAPRRAATASPAVISLTSTASTEGVPAATATTTATLAPAGAGGGTGRGGGAVRRAATGVPSTGSNLSVAEAGFLVLGGLGLVLLGVRSRSGAPSRGGPPPARSR